MDLGSRRWIYLLCFALWLAAVLGFGGLAVVNEFRKPLANKDYPIWYQAGRDAMTGLDIYAVHRGTEMNFTYPPFAASGLYGPLSLLGNHVFVIALVLLQTAAWAGAILLSVRLVTGSAWRADPWLYLLPALVTVSGVWTSYQLGQVNLMLLPLMLGGFVLLGRPGRSHRLAAGLLFATATAIKAFPLLIVGYLLWRRQWLACAGFAAGLVLMLLVWPGVVRGFDTAWDDLHTWTSRVMLSGDETRIGQRQAGWAYHRENQSLQATTVRLLSPMPYDDKPDGPPRFVNVLSLDFSTARAVAIAVAVGLTALLVWLMPPRRKRTAATDCLEQSMVICLIAIFSPLAWGYYLVWLLFPLTVLLHHIGEIPTQQRRRIGWLAAWFAAALWPLLAFDTAGVRQIHAAGSGTWATLAVFGMLGVWLHRQRRETNAS